MARQVVGGPARCAHQVGDLAQRLRVLLQQREVGGAPADRIEQRQAAGQRDVRIRRQRAGLDQARHQWIEARPHLRRHLPIAAAGTQVGQPLRRRDRVGKAPARQFGGAQIDVAGAGPQAIEFVAGPLGLRENRTEMPADAGAMAIEINH